MSRVSVIDALRACVDEDMQISNVITGVLGDYVINDDLSTVFHTYEDFVVIDHIRMCAKQLELVRQKRGIEDVRLDKLIILFNSVTEASQIDKEALIKLDRYLSKMMEGVRHERKRD